MQNGIELKTSVKSEVDGKQWHLFSADFNGADGKFGFYFYALSFDHARLVLQDIKDTATLCGQVGGFIPG